MFEAIIMRSARRRAAGMPGAGRFLPARAGVALALATAVATAVACMLPGRVAAQGGDMLLSSGAEEMLLPADARIQSVGRIGELRLAVWGASIKGTGSAAINQLRMQLLRDTVPVGPQTVLTADAARPFGYVQVIPAAGRFFVFWNDRRSVTPATYLMRVDTNGAAASEEIFWNGSMASAGIIPFATTHNLLLLWSDTAGAGSIQSRMVNAAGAFATPASRFADGIARGIIRSVVMPGYTIIDRGDLAPLLLDNNGSIHPLGAAAAKFAQSYYLDDGGSVMTISGDTVLVYTTPLDTKPSRIVTVPLPPGAIPGMQLVSRDSLGRLRVTFGQVVVNDFSAGLPGWVDMQIFEMMESAPGIFTVPVKTAGIRFADGATHCSSVHVTTVGVKSVRGCGTSYRFIFDYIWYERSDCQGIIEQRNFPGSISFIQTNAGLVIDSLLPGGFNLDPSAFIYRAPTKYTSDVDVVVGVHLVRLSAPGVFAGIARSQHSPALQSVGGKVAVAWVTTGADTIARLGYWNRSRTSGVDTLPGLDVVASAPELITESNASVSWWMMPNGGRIILGAGWSWAHKDIDGVTRPRQRLILYAPVSGGWSRVWTEDAQRPEGKLFPYACSVDPASREATVMVAHHPAVEDWAGRLYDQPHAVFGIDTNPRLVWGRDAGMLDKLQNLRALGFIGIGTAEYLIIGVDSTVHVKDATVATAIRPTAVGLFFKALGSVFLRSSIDVPIVLDEYTFEGLATKHGTVPNTTSPTSGYASNEYIIQNPIDSGFAIVYGGDGGVKLATVDKDLKLVESPHVISATHDNVAHPVAVFMGDSLYVAWEDSRNGNPDIYGTVAAVRTRSEAHRKGDDPSGRTVKERHAAP